MFLNVTGLFILNLLEGSLLTLLCVIVIVYRTTTSKENQQPPVVRVSSYHQNQNTTQRSSGVNGCAASQLDCRARHTRYNGAVTFQGLFQGSTSVRSPVEAALFIYFSSFLDWACLPADWYFCLIFHGLSWCEHAIGLDYGLNSMDCFLIISLDCESDEEKQVIDGVCCSR